MARRPVIFRLSRWTWCFLHNRANGFLGLGGFVFFAIASTSDQEMVANAEPERIVTFPLHKSGFFADQADCLALNGRAASSAWRFFTEEIASPVAPRDPDTTSLMFFSMSRLIVPIRVVVKELNDFVSLLIARGSFGMRRISQPEHCHKLTDLCSKILQRRNGESELFLHVLVAVVILHHRM